jgi:hypothetical protein
MFYPEEPVIEQSPADGSRKKPLDNIGHLLKQVTPNVPAATARNLEKDFREWQEASALDS